MRGRNGPPSGRLVALGALLLVGCLLVIPTAIHGIQAQETEPMPARSFVAITDDSSAQLWPYTSRRMSFDTATLPINVVINREADFVRYQLVHTSDADWNVTSSRFDDLGNTSDSNASEHVESGVIINGTSLEWTHARGSTRYSYVRGPDQGNWVDETYQLHHGSYFGARYHLRLYEGGSGEGRWTAIQAHREHWDWFRLRHTVDSVDRAQDHVESEFRTAGFPTVIRRTWFANNGALDSDGWVTSIDVLVGSVGPVVLPGLVLLVPLSGPGVSPHLTRTGTALRSWLDRPLVGPRHLLLLSSLFLLVLGVRVGAIAVEQSVQGVSPKVIAAAFYPLLVLGLPACAIFFARGLQPGEAALTAAMGFGAGIVADYAYIDITVLPVEVILHRTLLLTTVAVLAAGSASDTGLDDRDGFWNGLLVLGVLQWIVSLAIPLFDLL